jgi:hypothetical protein
LSAFFPFILCSYIKFYSSLLLIFESFMMTSVYKASRIPACYLVFIKYVLYSYGVHSLLTEFCSLFLALPTKMACFLSALCSFDMFLLFGYGQTKRLVISAIGKQIVFEPGN